ncbi:MAG: T9SS type A sorting domain-containing protein [Bacteroidetes bacterium]|nr:MAG: T9SS type A sorting domain-containing protein [Bacteroidota bacterium]
MFCPIKRNAATSYSVWATDDGTTSIPATGDPGRIYNAGSGYAQRTGYTTFSKFGIGKAPAPFPVELLFFDARPSRNFSGENAVDVTWATASESNNDYFSVECSQNGLHFEEVTRVTGAGNTSTTHNYSAVDNEPYNGISYYRLRQTDFNGQFTYSNIVRVNLPAGDVMLVYPNPSGKDEPFNVSISGKKGKKTVIVLRDLLGREFYSKAFIVSSDREVFAVDTEGKLASGIYFVVAASDNTIYEKKIMIK